MLPSCFCCGRPETAPRCERCDTMVAELVARQNGLAGVADIMKRHWMALPKYHYPDAGAAI